MFRIILRVFLILLIIIAFIAHFVLLIVKIDRFAEISYTVVGIPAFVAYGLIFLWAAYWSLRGYIQMKEEPEKQMLYKCLLLITGGAIISQALLVKKYDYLIDISYWQSLLPFIFFVFLAGILYIFAVTLNYFSEEKKNKYN